MMKVPIQLQIPEVLHKVMFQVYNLYLQRNDKNGCFDNQTKVKTTNLFYKGNEKHLYFCIYFPIKVYFILFHL